MNGHTRSVLPHYDVFTAPNVVVPPGAMTEASAGVGLGMSKFFALSPIVAAMKGLGDDAPVATAPTAAPVAAPGVTAGDVVWTVAILGVVGALCYQAGKAISPSKQEASTWGWIGVPVGLFTGVLGLGVMGAVSNHRKG